MKVQIKGTEQIVELNIIDRRTGVYWTNDFIGNWGALSDGQFTRIEDTDVYEADQDTYEWWAKVLADHQDLEDRINDLNDEHGKEAVGDIVSRVDTNDLEDLAPMINAALDEAFGGTAGN